MTIFNNILLEFFNEMNCYKKNILFVLLALFTVGHSVHSQESKITKNSILEIQVYGHPELSKTVVVRDNGTIDYPLVPSIPIDDLTLSEFREVLKAQAAKYTGEASIITVRFAQTLVIPVTVLGQVIKPGEYPVPRNSTVQGAIAQAGGLTPRAQIDRVKLIRQNGEQKETILVDFERFFIEGNPELLPKLEEGDVIVVPGVYGSNDVKILGAVRMPGSYPLFQGANLLDVIYMAGGPQSNGALNKIRLISYTNETSREQKINLKKILKNNADEMLPAVKPGDVVYVPERVSWLQILRDAISILSPLVIILYYLGIIERR